MVNLPPLHPAGLCPDWDQWDQTKPVDNAREAMQQADDWLGIPQVRRGFSDPPPPPVGRVVHTVLLSAERV